MRGALGTKRVDRWPVKVSECERIGSWECGDESSHNGNCVKSVGPPPGVTPGKTMRYTNFLSLVALRLYVFFF
jgi:hypothetical protein